MTKTRTAVLSEVTVEEALALEHNTAVLLLNAEGALLSMAVRHMFRNSGPNHGRIGWLFSNEEGGVKNITEIMSPDTDVISVFPEVVPVLTGVGDAADYASEEEEDEAVDRWFEARDAALENVTPGCILAFEVDASEGDDTHEYLGIARGDARWQFFGCGWADDEEGAAFLAVAPRLVAIEGKPVAS